MKSGKTLIEMAQELERIQKEAKDFVSPVERIEMNVVKAKPVLTLHNGTNVDLAPNSWAHSQLATYTDIPKQYYERISTENPQLLADSVNHGLRRVRELNPAKGESRMLRTVGPTLRAFVSSRYRRLDSYDLMEAVAPTLIENKFEVDSCQLTDMRFYLKAVTPKVVGEIKKGDAVQFGLVISSSDVGAGSVRVEPLIYRLVCLNGLIMPQAIRKAHLGRDLADTSVYELLTDDTRDLTDKAFWAQVKDVVTASMDPKRFEQELNLLRAAAGDPIKNYDIPEVVELAARSIGVTGEKTKESVVAYLANGADGAGLTRWGLINGFTHAAQEDHINYDESVDMERNATKLLHLPSKQWHRIAEKLLTPKPNPAPKGAGDRSFL